MKLRVVLMAAPLAVVSVGAVACVLEVPVVSLPKMAYPFCNVPLQLSQLMQGKHRTLSDDTANYTNVGSQSFSAAWFGYDMWKVNGTSYFGNDPRPIPLVGWNHP
jgi:hypothetical protein